MMRVVKIHKDDWKILSEKAHLIVFNESKNAESDRLDFSLVVENKIGKLLMYATCRENHADHLYIQYGGAFPETKDTVHSWKAFQEIIRWIMERYKSASMYVENTNFPMLKMAMKIGFKITGLRTFKNSVLLEHYMEFK